MSKKHAPVYLAGMPDARQPHEVWTRVGDQVWDQVGTSREVRIMRGRRETNPLVSTSRAQSQVLRGTFRQGGEVALYADVTSGTLADVERILRSHAGPSVGAGYVSECAASIVSTGSGVLGWVTYTMDEPA